MVLKTCDLFQDGLAILLKKKMIIWAGVAQWIGEPKHHRSNFPSGHMPGPQARFPGGGVLEATAH